MKVKIFFATTITALFFLKGGLVFAQNYPIVPNIQFQPTILLQTPLLQSGKVLTQGEYKVGAFIPVKTDVEANITLQTELPMTQSSSLNALISLGSFTSITGGYKWIPYPDLEVGQPAIGGILYINYHLGDFITPSIYRLLLGPIVSKEIYISSVALNLYSSVLANFQNAETYHRFSFNLGGDFNFTGLQDFSFTAEWAMGFGNFQNFPIGYGVGIASTIFLGVSMVF